MQLSFPGIFKNKNYMLLWSGQSVSKLGNNFYSIAMMWYIYKLTESSLSLGISALCTTLPIVICEPIGGVVADRYNKKKIIVAADFINGCLMLLLAYLTMTSRAHLYLLYVFMIMISIVSAFFSPAISSSTPLIVDQENLPKANSLGQFSTQITSIIGPALAGILITFAHMWILFLINGLSFIISAISESFITIPYIPKVSSKNTFKTSFFEGIHCILKEKGILYIVLLGAVINFFLAPLNIYGTIMASDILKVGSTGLGILFSSVSAGALIGALVVLSGFVKNTYRMSVVGFSLEGVTLVILAYFSHQFIPVVFILIILGFGICMASIGISTLYQTIIPKEMMGRVMSLVGILLSTTVPLGSLFGAIMISHITITAILAASGMIILITTFIAAPIIFKLEKTLTSPQVDM